MNDTNLGHPKTGIISVGLVLANILIFLFLVAVSYILESIGHIEYSLSGYTFIFLFVIAPVISLIGLIFGIIGTFKKGSRKILSILGIVFNGLWLVLAVVWWILLAILAYIGSNMVGR